MKEQEETGKIVVDYCKIEGVSDKIKNYVTSKYRLLKVERVDDSGNYKLTFLDLMKPEVREKHSSRWDWVGIGILMVFGISLCLLLFNLANIIKWN